MRHAAATNTKAAKTVPVTEDGGDLQVLTPGDPANAPEVLLESPAEGVVKGSALDKNPPSAEDAAEQAPERKVYRVTRGGMYADPNTKARTQIRAGKEVDNLNYNIRDLQKQGIKLERIEAGSDPLDDRFVE